VFGLEGARGQQAVVNVLSSRLFAMPCCSACYAPLLQGLLHGTFRLDQEFRTVLLVVRP
jgi:hypothetical protein